MGRRLREAGEVIRLGGVDYCLEGVEGCGGSAIVYRASYEDRLNQGCFHQALIKELYPFCAGEEISRDEQGNIICSPEGKTLMDSSRRSFLAGNQANLQLLKKMPEQISGNLNSYEAYGTYYSVLSVHGGISLMTLLDEHHAFHTLRETAVMMLWILEALKCFHQEGILHLDISPDNILVLKKQVLLIDYNSIWQIGGAWDGEFFFSEKDGYTAPEIRLRRLSAIGPAADLFSVCAIFFRMMTGRRLTDEDLAGKGPGRCLSGKLEILQQEPPSVVWKATQIVVRGLHMLPKKRYQSADELEKEFQELILRIDGKGISHSAVWESSSRMVRKFQKENQSYLERRLLAGKEEYGASECFARLSGGEQILLTGGGGLGKTCFLKEMACRYMKKYSSRSPAVIYVPLADYQAAGGEAFYIRKSILRRLCFSEQTGDMEMAMHELEQLFDEAAGTGVRYVLLLDGLNEAGKKRQGLLLEIEKLGKQPGIGILVTDRTDSVKKYGLHGFSSACLLPLTEEQVKAALKEDSADVPPDAELLEMLVNPMMLSLYRQTVRMARKQQTPERSGKLPQNMEEMIRCYLESLNLCQLRVDSGNLEEQLRHSYVLMHFLPSVAWEMKRRARVILTHPELYEVCTRSYRGLQKKQFAMAFPEYTGKSRLMLKGISNEGEWFDYAVREHLMEHLNLLDQSEGGNYRLCHDNFLNYFAEEHRKNRSNYWRAAGKLYGVRAGIGCFALILLVSGAAAARRFYGPRKLTEEERTIVRNGVQRLLINLQLLDVQLMNQENLLKECSKEAVLNGEPAELENLRKQIERICGKQQQYQMTASDGSALLAELDAMGGDIPLETLQRLYLRTFDMEDMMAEALEHLESCLCDADSVYGDREKREPIITAYEQFLQAYGAVVYLELNQVLWYMEEASMGEENVDLMLDGVAEMNVLKRYMLQYPLSGVNGEELARQLDAANSQLEDAKGALRKQNFPMKAAGWQ